METKCNIQIRHYDPKDYPTLMGWWKYRDAERLHESLIPPSSVVVEDNKGLAAFAALYLCNSNHVAFMHGLVTRPDMTLQDSFQILESLQDGIDIMAEQAGHSVIMGSCENETIAKKAKRFGFHYMEKPCYQIVRIVKPKNTP